MSIKRYLMVGLVVLSLLAMLVPAYGIANAKSPKPQDQVKQFMSAAAGLKVSKATAYCVTEERSNVTAQLAKVPSGTKISLSKLKLVVTNQTVDTANVSATYAIKIKLKSQKKDQKRNLSDTFELKLVNGIWLISSTTMFGKWAGLITSSTPTATPTATSTAAVTPTATSTPSPTASSNQVKIGAIIAWSGPMAVSGLLADSVIKLVEWQVKQQGGILGGRDFKVVKYDDEGQVAQAAAGAKKLIESDKVCLLVFGGSYGAEQLATSQAAEAGKVMYLAFGDMPEFRTNNFAANCMIAAGTWGDYWLKLGKMLNAKTVAWLGTDQSDVRDRNARTKGLMQAAGIKTVYEQYIQADVQDLSSYITKIKYEAPDILCADFSNEQYVTLGKQISELGGIGNTKLLAMTQASTAGTKTKGFEGQYVLVAWMPGMTSPEAVKYEQDFKTVNGTSPNPNHIYYYVCLWTAIHAVQTAGSDADPVKIAQVVRSGNLEFDTPIGRAHFTTDGNSGLGLTATQVQGGKLVPVDLPAQ